jgi:hypothetical protein
VRVSLVSHSQLRSPHLSPLPLARGEAEFAGEEILYRRTPKGSWEQAAHMFGLDDAFDADGHGRCAMRDSVFFGSSDHLRKRVLKDAEKFVGHFAFCP